MTPLLSVRNISCSRPEGDQIFSNVSFNVNEGDIAVLQARSGIGKTTLLKCVAHLNLYHGSVEFKGRTPKAYGVPTYRTHVQYVPQRPSLLPGTPRELFHTLSTFQSRRATGAANLNKSIDVARSWGIDEELWDRAWNTLSGGEAQRIALAISFGMNGTILLLDEPTSALDADASLKVERALIEAVRSPESPLQALVWITHSEEQATRVGTRFLRLSPTGIREETSIPNDA